MCIRLFLIVLMLSSIMLSVVQGQITGLADYNLFIKKTNSKINVDGKLDEKGWEEAEAADNFYQKYPYDTSYSVSKTEVKMTYDDKHIYIGAVCYDHLPGEHIIQSLKRDFDFGLNDAFGIIIDPFNDGRNGFGFWVSPLGVLNEGLISGGGGDYGYNKNWDDLWIAEVVILSDRWVVEIAIPFKTMRFKEGSQQWRINFARNDLKRNELSTWVPVPSNLEITSLAYTGTLNWDFPLKKSGSNVAIIPFSIGGVTYDYEKSGSVNHSINGGLDAKVAVTSSLNLDLTINSDFSQIEVDAQQTNLSRYDLFYPEKRTFFLENNDLFGEFGFREIRPFFSRKIGLFNGEKVPIIGGARLSGKLNEDWRIGIMSIQTEGVGKFDLKSQNYSSVAIQRKIFSRSNIAAIIVNRQSFDEYEYVVNDFNRVAGLDFNMSSKNDKWTGKFFYHTSINPDDYVEDYSHASWLMYSTKKMLIMWNHEFVGKDYMADVGFVPRNKIYNPVIDKVIGQSYYRLEPFAKYMFYPQSKWINKHGPAIYFNQYMNNDFVITDQLIMPHYIVNFQNSSSIEFHYHEMFTQLHYNTDITFSGSTPIPSGNYSYRNAMIKYESNMRRNFFYTFRISSGTYYNGHKYSINSELSYKKQPWGVFSVTVNREGIDLPQPYSDKTLTLTGTKLEFSFTKKFFFTTYIQYNTQLNNVNLNSRMQYRFKPMSDIYIVYTDNYFFTAEQVTNLQIKNRAIVIKFIYWINI